MRKYPIHVNEERVKRKIHYVSPEEVSKKIYDKQFTTVITHKNV